MLQTRWLVSQVADLLIPVFRVVITGAFNHVEANVYIKVWEFLVFRPPSI